MKTLRSALTLLAVALGAVSCVRTDSQSTPVTNTPAAPKTLVNIDSKRLALEGYDPVAYFTDKKPVMGRPEFTASHEGAIYHFFSPAHRDLFLKKPDRYAPAFGGYCGYAASIGDPLSLL